LPTSVLFSLLFPDSA